jgi:flagellar M-ring protein FliF
LPSRGRYKNNDMPAPLLTSVGGQFVPEALKSIGVVRLGAMAGMTAALFGFFGYLMMGMSKEPMSLLYAGLDPKDSAAIVAKLDAAKIPYELQTGGSTIMVPSDKALRLRMDYAGQGLPAGGSVGYEIFDTMDAFGQTSFVQNVNMVRALEGELARTIRSLDQIGSARVHLVIPKKELFAKDTGKPTASVVLRSRGGRIGPAQVAAIQNLVSSSINGMSPDAVTVIDEKGVLLASGNASDMSAARLDDRTAAYQERLRASVEDILGRIVGPGRARVQVTADMDYAKITKSSETFDPDGQVIRKTESTNEREQGQNRRDQQGVTVANNLPPGAQGQPAAGGTQSTNETNRTGETVEYEISRSTQTEIQEAGRVKRLSVAVVVDGTYADAPPPAEGQPAAPRTYAPRSADDMKQIEQLVKSSIGFDEKRGDQVTVTNLRFSEPDVELAIPEEEALLGLGKGDMWKIAQFAGMGILALLMIFLVLRPLVKAFTTAPQMSRSLASLPGGAAMAGALPSGAQAALPGQPAAALPAPSPELAGAMIDIAQIEGQVKESSVRKVGEIIGKHPDEATAIMRQWLHEAS